MSIRSDIKWFKGLVRELGFEGLFLRDSGGRVIGSWDYYRYLIVDCADLICGVGGWDSMVGRYGEDRLCELDFWRVSNLFGFDLVNRVSVKFPDIRCVGCGVGYNWDTCGDDEVYDCISRDIVARRSLFAKLCRLVRFGSPEFVVRLGDIKRGYRVYDVCVSVCLECEIDGVKYVFMSHSFDVEVGYDFELLDTYVDTISAPLFDSEVKKYVDSEFNRLVMGGMLSEEFVKKEIRGVVSGIGDMRFRDIREFAKRVVLRG